MAGSVGLLCSSSPAEADPVRWRLVLSEGWCHRGRMSDLSGPHVCGRGIVCYLVGGEQVSVRPGVEDDAWLVADFLTACWREDYAGIVPQEYLRAVGAQERVSRWRERLTTGSRLVALAELRGDLLGLVSWGAADEYGIGAPPLELKSLYVASGHRGSGLGATLLRHAIADRDAYLWCFRDNRRAQEFYRRHRFVPDGTEVLDPDSGAWSLRMARRG